MFTVAGFLKTALQIGGDLVKMFFEFAFKTFALIAFPGRVGNLHDLVSDRGQFTKNFVCKVCL